jgi:putative addiction module killer protein
MNGYQLREYLAPGGGSPFNDWLAGLRDIRTRARIRTRLERASLGNLGDYASIGDGVFEMRLFQGPGYRIYFGLESVNIVVLLCGGSKDSQRHDIQKAKSLWADYRKRNESNQQKLPG